MSRTEWKPHTPWTAMPAWPHSLTTAMILFANRWTRRNGRLNRKPCQASHCGSGEQRIRPPDCVQTHAHGRLQGLHDQLGEPCAIPRGNGNGGEQGQPLKFLLEQTNGYDYFIIEPPRPPAPFEYALRGTTPGQSWRFTLKGEAHDRLPHNGFRYPLCNRVRRRPLTERRRTSPSPRFVIKHRHARPLKRRPGYALRSSTKFSPSDLLEANPPATRWAYSRGVARRPTAISWARPSRFRCEGSGPAAVFGGINETATARNLNEQGRGIRLAGNGDRGILLPWYDFETVVVRSYTQFAVRFSGSTINASRAPKRDCMRR